eukprot:CAMPEP_0170258762 /NCGR_PEP_ID=MMETSP0116_2-20130129/29248_1 /TAXON_ID=400756 /ORGANISM="Durinskia baltica, Strain CSIRO CS-38" /LENGTH=61 /DNA_ID=CAMNT_0010509799 /DNA_START=89 /DNA_END=274 /DNA_ORIENTATION=-
MMRLVFLQGALSRAVAATARIRRPGNRTRPEQAVNVSPAVEVVAIFARRDGSFTSASCVRI